LSKCPFKGIDVKLFYRFVFENASVNVSKMKHFETGRVSSCFIFWKKKRFAGRKHGENLARYLQYKILFQLIINLLLSCCKAGAFQINCI